LTGYGCLYIGSRSGFFVVTTDRAVIPDNTIFEFSLTVRDPNFHGYTALTLPSRTIRELYHKEEKKTYRYKENVPVWSNTAGASRTSGSGKTLFLSKDVQSMQPEDGVESLILKSGGLWQLTSDQPSADTQEIGSPVSALPVFASQADIPTLVAPEGLSGVPGRGIQLTDELPNNIFGLIRLAAVRPSDPDFSFIDNSGHAKTAYPVYQLRFKSRSTYRQYFDKKTSASLSSESSALPLTFFGNAGTKQKPQADRIDVKKAGNKITKLVSEIFI
ncbi:MAG: hypothetical protein HGB19_06365, partial [Chlorobiales bacterium]|nr:hypothetical protein [Chlorobiales bacterium]